MPLSEELTPKVTLGEVSPSSANRAGITVAPSSLPAHWARPISGGTPSWSAAILSSACSAVEVPPCSGPGCGGDWVTRPGPLRRAKHVWNELEVEAKLVLGGHVQLCQTRCLGLGVG